MICIRTGFVLGNIEKIDKTEKFGKEKGKLCSFLKEIFFNSGSSAPHDYDLCYLFPPATYPGALYAYNTVTYIEISQ